MKYKTKILIIDDEINIINALKRLFLKFDYEILSTTKPEEGKEIIKDTSLDMIICDYNMPDVNGIDVLKYAKEVQPDAVRILITGHSDVNIAISAINEGDVYYYISKPWKNEEVINIIQKRLRKKQNENEQNSIIKQVNKNHTYITELVDKLELTKKPANKSTKIHNKKFPVYEDETIILINSEDILYITSSKGSIHVYTTNGEYLSHEVLTAWEEKLGKSQFFRSHRSYIVNIEKIEKISPWFNGTYNLKLVNYDENIPVSRGNTKVLKEMFGI